MKNKVLKIISILLYLVSLFLLIFYFKNTMGVSNNLDPKFKLIIIIVVCLLVYISGFILCKFLKLESKKKLLKFNLVIYFLLYLVLIFSFTLFETVYGRQGFTFVDWNFELLENYSKYYLNLIPFETVSLYINAVKNGYISVRLCLMNVLGNLCAFMPFSLFLPLLFKSMNKFKNFFITMFLTISLILNLLGASIMYFIIKIKCVNKFIRGIFVYEN